MTGTQLSLTGDSIPQKFAAWKDTAGGRFCLQKLYNITAGYFHAWRRTGQAPSTRLVWEQLRYRLDEVRAKAKTRGQELRRVDGFWLNDHFTALAVRHMLARRPDWDGLFELRELGRSRHTPRTIVVKQGVVIGK